LSKIGSGDVETTWEVQISMKAVHHSENAIIALVEGKWPYEINSDTISTCVWDREGM